MELQQLAERIFLEKYGNKITASESWLILFAIDVCEKYNKQVINCLEHEKECIKFMQEIINNYEKEIDLLKGNILRIENKLDIRGKLIEDLTK